MTSPLPAGAPLASSRPEAVPTDAQTPEPTTQAPVSNITDKRITQFYSSPLDAMEQVPELEELAQLSAGSKAASLLSNSTVVSTIFAPNNEVRILTM